MKTLTISNEKVAIGTNVIIYAIENQDSKKSDISLELLRMRPYVSNQAIAESINVLKRLYKNNNELCILKILQLLKQCRLIINNEDIYYSAKYLMKKYKFGLYDSIIVANALLENCTVLYTEDMYEVLIEKKMKIINPFSNL